MQQYQAIRDLVGNDNLEDALASLKAIVDMSFPGFSNDVTILLANYNRHKRNSNIGLKNDDTTLRKIGLAVLEICDDLTQRTQNALNDSPPDGNSNNNYYLEAKHLELIIGITQSAIKRTWIFATFLIICGIALLILTHSGLIPFDKTIMTIASTLIASISGYPINGINSKYGTIKTFEYLKNVFMELSNGTVNVESEEVDRMRQIIWNTIGKTAANI